MASTFQQQAFNRKLIYVGLILVLFTAALIWRKGDVQLFGMDIKGVDAQARDLAIREESHGEVDLLGAIVRLSTMGLRGMATCYQWINAMDAQKKNQWNELELNARILTKLQPHFITPWLFQSWNLSYNVSVESDRVNDKYFYIARGIGLLAEGERQNRDNPDIRWSIGFFTQHKICQSDETNVLRSLSQLSMIPPNERDPSRFWTRSEGDRYDVNLTELEDFCKGHPQLVRRLREGMRRTRKSEQFRQFRCETAVDLVQFLEDNYRVPSLWITGARPQEKGAWKKKDDQEKPLADRFPVLPPRHETSRPYQQPPDLTVLHDESKLLDEHDAYQVARAWYAYAQEPLPKPGDMPGTNEPVVNRVYQRIPKKMTTVIFRDYPAQAQRFTAERLQEEGWYDESGWAVRTWFEEAGNRFANGGPAVIGTEQPWGKRSWELTAELWRRFGVDNHMLLDPAEQNRYDQRAKAYAEKKHLQEGAAPPILSQEEEGTEMQLQRDAWLFLRALGQAKHLCNIDFHYNRARVEAMDETIQARKIFLEALDARRLDNDDPLALRKYLDPKGMRAWRKILLNNRDFRGDSMIQEQTFEVQLRYVDLFARLSGATFNAQVAAMVMMPSLNPPGGGACPIGLAYWVPPLIPKDWDNPLLGGPFDMDDDDGQPLIAENSRNQLLQRLFPALIFGTQQNTQDAAAPEQAPGSQSR